MDRLRQPTWHPEWDFEETVALEQFENKHAKEKKKKRKRDNVIG